MKRHPLHPALVHFPICCWSLASFADAAGVFMGYDAFGRSVGVLLAIGTISGLGAMLAGLLELHKLKDPKIIHLANIHMNTVLAAWTCYAASLLLRVKGGDFIEPNTLALTCSIVGFITLLVAAWFGGRLVYEHGVGTHRPAQE